MLGQQVCKTTATGTAVYKLKELHQPMQMVLASIEIGGGTLQQEILQLINCKKRTLFIKTETDPNRWNNVLYFELAKC
jgi:hypothetical protein